MSSYTPHGPVPADMTLERYAAAWVDMEPHIHELGVYARGKRVIVEFGLRGAVSTWAMIDAMPADGRLIGVDIDGGVPIPPRVREDPRFELVVGEAATVKLPVRHADMVMIDAGHEFTDTVLELVRAASLGPEVICCHDYLYEPTPGVRRAIDGFTGPGYLREFDSPYELRFLHRSRWGLAVLVRRDAA